MHFLLVNREWNHLLQIPIINMETSSTPSSAQRVVVIDDHIALNEMLVQVIGLQSGYEAAGWAATAAEGVELCRRIVPDIIVLDMVMPNVTGISLLQELKQAAPKARFIVFSGNLTPRMVKAVLGAGVQGVVGKGASIDELREALDAVRDDRVYFGSQVRDMVKDLVTQPDKVTHDQAALTPRERTILQCIAQGMSSREMADKLGVSVNTIVNHRSNLMKKTGLHRVAQLSLYAAQIGLVEETF